METNQNLSKLGPMLVPVNMLTKSLSHVWLFVTPWDIPGKNIGVGLPFPTPEYIPNPEIKPMCLTSPTLAGGFFSAEPPGKQVITSLGYHKVLNLESGTREILTGDVHTQWYIIIAHMIMEWPCSQRIRQNLMTKQQQHQSFTICQTEITTVFTRLCACSVAHSRQILCSPVNCSP